LNLISLGFNGFHVVVRDIFNLSSESFHQLFDGKYKNNNLNLM